MLRPTNRNRAVKYAAGTATITVRATTPLRCPARQSTVTRTSSAAEGSWTARRVS